MAWAKIALEKRIGWRSYRADGRVTLPPSRDIPSTHKYSNGGLVYAAIASLEGIQFNWAKYVASRMHNELSVS